MGSQIMQISIVALTGALTYQILLALGHKEMAAMVQIVCYAIASTNALNIFMRMWAAINSSPLARLITKLGG